MVFALILLVLGLAWPLLLNGQTFTNSLAGVASLTGALAICIILERREGDSNRRFARRAIMAISAFSIPILIVMLPANYRFQQRFNERIGKTDTRSVQESYNGAR